MSNVQSIKEWLPAVIATAAGLGVAYVALSQATRACEVRKTRTYALNCLNAYDWSAVSRSA